MTETSKYKVFDGTSFDIETPEDVCRILNQYRQSRERLRIFNGSNGKMWLEENHVIGIIGRSTGTYKIPLLIANSRSMGGGAVLDHCIVRTQDAKTKRVLYKKPGYSLPEFEIVPSQFASDPNTYPYQVFANKEHAASFKTRIQAENYIAFMRGERMRK